MTVSIPILTHQVRTLPFQTCLLMRLTLGIVGLDAHRDTPTEILHTVLLGVVKYLWAQSFCLIAGKKKTELFRARLDAMTIDGLDSSPLTGGYMCQYRGSLVGKHFKILSQVMSFAVMGIVPDEVQKGWLLTGKLVVLLWHTSIDDLEPYLVSDGDTVPAEHLNNLMIAPFRRDLMNAYSTFSRS